MHSHIDITGETLRPTRSQLISFGCQNNYFKHAINHLLVNQKSMQSLNPIWSFGSGISVYKLIDGTGMMEAGREGTLTNSDNVHISWLEDNKIREFYLRNAKISIKISALFKRFIVSAQLIFCFKKLWSKARFFQNLD